MTESGPHQTEEGTETEDERLDRNWTELLQELRVTQTGTQILTGFLLTLAFQQRFTKLDDVQTGVYLALVIITGVTTAFALAPVSLHRALFRQGLKERIVRLTNYLLKATLVGVAAALTGVVFLVFDVVVSRGAAFGAAAFTLIVTVAVWLVLPVFAKPRRRS